MGPNRWRATVVLALTAATACGESAGVPEAPCASDDACERGLVCQSGLCVVPSDEEGARADGGGILQRLDGGVGVDAGPGTGGGSDGGGPQDASNGDGSGGGSGGGEDVGSGPDAGPGSDGGSGGGGGIDVGPSPNPNPVVRGNYGFRSINLNAREGLWRVATSYDGRTVVAGNYNARLYVLDVATETLVRTVDIPRGSANSLLLGDIAFSPVGAELLVSVTARQGSTQQDGRLYRIDDVRQGVPELMGTSIGMFVHEIVFRGADADIVGYERISGQNHIIGVHEYSSVKGDFALTASFPVQAGCRGLARAQDGFGQSGLVYTCGIGGGDIGFIDEFQFLSRGPNAGNVSFVSARPVGDYALAPGWTGARLYRFDRGTWTTGAGAPDLGHPGLQRVAFSSSGQRALVFGEYNDSRRRLELREYRHDAYSSSGLTDVSIQGFNLAPYLAPDGSGIFDAAWLPQCDEGYMVGGCGEVDCRRGWLLHFEVTNGVACGGQ